MPSLLPHKTPLPGPDQLAATLRRLRHDLRTPITGILGYAELLLEEYSTSLRLDLAGDLQTLVGAARQLAGAIDEGTALVEAREDAERMAPDLLVRIIGSRLHPHLDVVIGTCQSALTRKGGQRQEVMDDLNRILTDARVLQAMIATDQTSLPTSSEANPALVAAEATDLLDQPGTILIVDDSPTGRDTLARRLGRGGHRLVIAEDVTVALAELRRGGIDLVLSDVLLPGENGLDLCRQIRRDPDLMAVPVILVTSLHERADRLAGIEAGANDFLSKPIDGPELMLRVRNALRGKRQYDAVLAANRRQTELEELRDHLTHLIVHDLRQPLSGLCGYLELFLQRSGDAVEPRLRDLITRAEHQGQHLARLVNQVLDVAKIEAGRMTMNQSQADLVDTVQQAIARLGPAERVPVNVHYPPALPWICDHALVARVVINIVGNALRFNPPGQRIQVRLEAGDEVRLTVEDRGPGIDPAYHQRIFEKFGQVAARRQQQSVTSGLGLFFCKLAVELHGGRIGVDSIPGQGSRFWFTLPRPDHLGDAPR